VPGTFTRPPHRRCEIPAFPSSSLLDGDTDPGVSIITGLQPVGASAEGGGEDGVGFPEGCGTDPPNEFGLGTICTAGGGECPGALICTEDYEETGEIGVCISIACSAAADCGEGGVCCLIPEADGLSLCLPPACVFSFCEALP
jgi:hypothetical protein